MRAPDPTLVTGPREAESPAVTGEPRTTKIALRSPRNAVERGLIDKLQRLIKKRGLAATELEHAEKEIVTQIERLRRAGMLL